MPAPSPKSSQPAKPVQPAEPAKPKPAATTDPGSAVRQQGEADELPEHTAELLQEPPKWIEIELLGDDGEPYPGEAFELILSNNRKRRGNLDANGFARVENIPDGPVRITFPNLDKGAWEPA